MNLDEASITCPYCWQSITIDIDVPAGSQTYTEDCQVCCNPILLRVQVDEEGGFTVDAEAENG